jgi:2-polyprenyl-6-methoxyphenol hydroxylase-like FAD-dependent oxidoreductase
MRIAVVGAGPAGFYPLILLKRAPFISEVRVFEQRKACISNKRRRCGRRLTSNK